MRDGQHPGECGPEGHNGEELSKKGEGGKLGLDAFRFLGSTRQDPLD